MMFEILVPFVMFDIIDSEYSSELVLYFDSEKHEEMSSELFS
jgi:hypothetical protein